MNFDFSEDEKALRSALRRVLADQCGIKTVRLALNGDSLPGLELWETLGRFGWLSASLPEAYGGQGLGYAALCGIAEELGHALAPVPLSSFFLVSEALLLAGSEGQKRTYLPGLARGETSAAAAFAETLGPLAAANVSTVYEDGRLSGTKIAVVDGFDADLALVPAREEGQVHLFLADLQDDRVARETQSSIDPTRPLALLRFMGATAEPLGGDRRADWIVLERLLDRAAVLTAFEQLGGAAAALSMARDYALNRHAFGRPIGGFQAIKHKLADVYIANELARSNAYYAAWALATDAAELPLAAATARVCATEAFERAARELIQTHGAAAITWDHDCQFYYRRSRHLALALGAPAQWRKRLVSELSVAHSA
jgi:acyl-CoA dehydrogenase